MEFSDSKKRKAVELSELITEEPNSLKPDSVDNLSTNSSVENKEASKNQQSSSSSGSVFGAGFSAYAKINPFAMAAKNSSFGFNVATGQKGEGTSHLRPNFTMPAPLTVPSPKSPKANPFSSPSPVHNPFMTIVESKDELWKTMAKDKLSDEEAAKTSLFESGAKRPRTSKFGYGFGDSFGFSSSSNNNASIEEPSALDTNKPLFASSYQDQDGDEEEGEEENEGEEASSQVAYQTYALPENPVVVTGEEDDECLLQMRVKLYRLNMKTSVVPKISAIMTLQGQGGTRDSSDGVAGIYNDLEHSLDTADEGCRKIIPKTFSSGSGEIGNSAEWIEVGIGPLKILQPKSNVPDRKEDKSEATKKKAVSRLVMRREDKKGGIGTKLLLNIRLDQYATVAQQSDKSLRILGVSYTEESSTVGTYLIKSKTTQECTELVSLVKELSASEKA